MRDRAILSVGLQVGLRRAEIAALRVGDLHQNRGYDSLRVMRKGGRRGKRRRVRAWHHKLVPSLDAVKPKDDEESDVVDETSKKVAARKPRAGHKKQREGEKARRRGDRDRRQHGEREKTGAQPEGTGPPRSRPASRPRR